MCFTVSIVRKGKIISAEEYYSSLPAVKNKRENLPELPFYNLVSGFSFPKLPIVTEDGVYLYDWGLIPSWVKNKEAADEIRSKTLNAIGETVFDKPSFRKSIESRRCLFPVSGFYEWRDVQGVKYPYYVQLKDTDYFSLGSLYDQWIDYETGEILSTFSIITTPANPLMAKIHNLKKRMPLILSPNDEMKWLDRSLKTEQIKDLIKPFPESDMIAHTISRKANNSRINRDYPEILEEVNYPELVENENLIF